MNFNFFKPALLVFTIVAFSYYLSHGQIDVDLSYYLPDIEYRTDIPTPKDFLGHEVGEWHVSHDKLYYYAKELAERTNRITLVEYAKSHEGRPLIYLIITSPLNQSRLDQIRTERNKLVDSSISGDVNIDELPAVIYQGCSIHGNEASGSNGALAMMYYLAAAQGDDVEKLLSEVIILFDPSFNPDGLHRFSTWVNEHRGKNLATDPVSREFNESWPGGRTNHYWFDLNRDWLLLTHPESQGRIKTFHFWKPDILTDHHEMGSNSTFFFQPGIPSRTNPNTPEINQQLTSRIGEFHAANLDKIGSLYYTKESYDDFYYGKGSTYPDIHGCIGILFEQAASRGHLRDTDHGLLSFPFTIRNQVATMFSTQQAALELRKKLLEYKRQTYRDNERLKSQNPVKAYVFGGTDDPVRENRMIDILRQHQVKIYILNKDHHGFKEGEAYIVPLDQQQYRLVKTAFEEVNQFQDSLFYDVSAWTLPHAYNIPHEAIQGRIESYIGDEIEQINYDSHIYSDNLEAYAYLIRWNQHNADRMAYQLLSQGVMVTVNHRPFSLNIADRLEHFSEGTLIIPIGNNQPLKGLELERLISELARENSLDVYVSSTGQVSTGINLGSRSTSSLQPPKIAMIIGDGVRSYNAGEIWHHFDQNLDQALTMIDVNDFNRVDLSKYNTLILAEGSYYRINDQVEKLKAWVQQGGTIISIGSHTANWLKSKQLIDFDKVSNEQSKRSNYRYGSRQKDRGAYATGGVIVKANIDTTHPLFYGYDDGELYFMRRHNLFLDGSEEQYNAPARYANNPVSSGYMKKTNADQLGQSVAVLHRSLGRGAIILLLDDPVFRGYWWGTTKLLSNSVFYGSLINN